MEGEQNKASSVESPTPGAAIGSFIVIAVLIAGAVYILGGELIKKPATEITPTPTATSSEIMLGASTTLQI